MYMEPMKAIATLIVWSPNPVSEARLEYVLWGATKIGHIEGACVRQIVEKVLDDVPQSKTVSSSGANILLGHPGSITITLNRRQNLVQQSS